MSDLTWKPGPPPLDQPGRYDAVFNDGVRCGINVMPGVTTCVSADSAPWYDLDLYSSVTVVWHFGPLPSPPD